MFYHLVLNGPRLRLLPACSAQMADSYAAALDSMEEKTAVKKLQVSPRAFPACCLSCCAALECV